jgi:chromate transporter
MSASPPAPVTVPSPSPSDLFLDFALIGLCGFGGVLPWARRRMVDSNRWVTDREFTELLALGQLLPGPNIANVAVMYGRRLHGPRGAAAAVCGLYAGPSVITIVMGLLYARYGQIALVQQVFGAMMPVAAGLLLGTALRLAKSLPPSLVAFGMVLAVFVAMNVLSWPLWVVLVTAIPASIALTAWRGRVP